MDISSSKVNSSFRRVLVASNFSAGFEEALLAAFQVCVMNQASLRILHVCRDPATTEADKERALDPDLLDNDVALQFRQMKERATGLGLDCTTRMERGVPSKLILEEIEREKIDLLVMGTSEPRGSKRLGFGPTAEQVLRKAPCPILTVGPVASNLMTAEELEGPVVFATDFHSVTRTAIYLAVSYCKSTNLQLHCLHVLPRTLKPTQSDDTLPDILTSALEHLVAATAALAEKTICSVTYGSSISNAVVDYARQQCAGMIILGVRRDSILAPDDPLPIVYRIIAEAPCPVMTILCDAEPHAELATTLGTMAAPSNSETFSEDNQR